jgi:DNA-binding CsgD family transcriptional regulator
MLAQGMTYKEIADKENVSVRGVNDCIYRAKAITGARTIIQLVVKVLYSGEEW